MFVLTKFKRRSIMYFEFEYDEKKNAENIIKHGVSFEDAEKVFYDPNRTEIFDKLHSIKEERWKIIGLAGWKLLTVICTERKGKVRLISARKADKKEKEDYFYGNSKTHSGH
jgi:uncharacterized DUF497 family protein